MIAPPRAHEDIPTVHPVRSDDEKLETIIINCKTQVKLKDSCMKNICFQMNRKAWLAIVMVLCLSLPALAQKITVTGTVVDATGEPLIGASVLEQGTAVGTATDIDGNYSISVSPKSSLVVSYVGYNTQTIPVNGRTTIDVTLAENTVVLNEVVAIGYGVVKKSDATGSVAMVKPDDIEAGMATSAQDLLVGASPGVVVTTNGGQPEGGATIRIRGGSSLNATNDPLIVLDGVPLSNEGVQGMSNPLAMISPDNIESMTILKDASATAIYGSRASNGVIIITTKKGQAGRPQVNFSANMYVNHARKKWDVLGADAYRDIIINYHGADSEAAAALGNANTKWQDQVLRTTVSHDYNLSIGGTVGFLPYRVSASYTKNNGIVKNSSMERVTVGFNLTPKFFNGKLSVSANAKGYYLKNRFVDAGGAVGAALAKNPTETIYTHSMPIKNSSFTYLYNGYSTDHFSNGAFNTNGILNPVAMVNDFDDVANVYRSNGNLQIDYALHFLPELHLNLNLGYDVSKSNEDKYQPENSPLAWNSYKGNGAGTHEHVYQLRRNTLLDFYMNYRKDFKAIKSNLDVMVGYSWQKFYAHGRNNGTVFTTPGFSVANISLNPDGTYNVPVDPATQDLIGTSYNPASSWANHLQLVSFFGRLNYTFDDTYLLTFTLRDDGTSRFSKENRWGLFPSLALGWKIINMPFMESARETMNDFKLRLGWGVTGQQDVGDSYFPYMATYAVTSNLGSLYPNMYTGTYVDANGNIISNTAYPNPYDPNIKWEETTTWNVGFDLGFLNNRITAALDWYLRNTKDLLCWVTVPAGSATSNQMWQNVGTLRNIGVEATINAKPIVTSDFTWNTGFNVAWNKNEITKLNNSDDPNAYITTGGISGGTGNTVQAHKVGYAANTFLLYEQVYDANGLPIEGCYVDQDGNGKIDDNDRVLKHSKDPKVTMSWNNTFNYKNWDFGFSLRASIGNYVYNDVLSTHVTLGNTYKNTTLSNLVVNDVYFTGNVTSNTYMSDYWLRNAGFVRCDNITIGYTWPDLLKNNLRLRLFGAVQNPFVITKYNGLDPEVSSGIDNGVYPRPVTYSIGLVATF